MRGESLSACIYNNGLTNNFQVNSRASCRWGDRLFSAAARCHKEGGKHTILVFLSTSSLQNVVPVGARSRFTQRKIINLFFFYAHTSKGGSVCVVETLVQLHTSLIGWNLRQSSPTRHAYWSRRPRAPPRLSVHLSKQNITPFLLFSLSVICANS